MSPKTGDTFSLFLPWVNTDAMNVYLEHLAEAHPGKKILLIWDGAGGHGSKGLHIPSNNRRESLPPYSPQFNPVEHLWQWLRRHVTRNRLFDSREASWIALPPLCKDLIPTSSARRVEALICDHEKFKRYKFRLLADLTRRDSIEQSMMLHGDDDFTVAVDGVLAAFPDQPKAVLFEVANKLAPADR